MNSAAQNRQPRRFGRGRKNRAIDGILRPSTPFSGTNNIGFQRPTSYQPSSEQVVGNFNQPDGYHAVDQGVVLTSPGSPDNADKVKSHRRIFARRPKRSTEGALTAPKAGRARLKSVLKALMIVILIGGGFLFAKGILKLNKVLPGGSEGALALQENIDPSLLKGEGDGRVNILVLGKGGEGHTAPDLTDTILIASLDPINNEAAILSVPRDLYVKIPGNGSTKINAVYARAKQITLSSSKQTAALKLKAEKDGLESLEKTLEETLGIPIHYQTMIDFEGFKKAIDAVSGVDINVATPLYEVMRIDGKQYILNVKKGWQHFDGFRALAYARSRHASARGDFDRAERQRLILAALKDKILSIGTFANPIKLSQLMDAFGDHVQTNLTINEMQRLYKVGKNVASDKITSVGLADPPNNFVKTGLVDGQSVVIPRAGVGNFSEIQSFIRNTLKDGFIKNENASIAILNGTPTTGLATKKAEELKSYGYNVTVVADAPTKDYQETVLVDNTKGAKKYTKRYLEKRLGVVASDKLPAGVSTASNTDFVIIVGREVTTR